MQRNHPFRLAVALAIALQCSAPATWAQAPAAPVAPAEAPRLRALVFAGSTQDLQAPAGASAVDTSRVPLLDAPRFAQGMRLLIGRPLTATTLAELRLAVAAWLQLQGRPFAYVSVPQQDATGGVVRVLVMEAHVGAVRVEGATQFADATYTDGLGLVPGEPLDAQALDDGLAWLQRANPYRSAVAVTAPGLRPGATDVLLRVSERRPWTVRLGADNTGVRTTGEARLTAAFTHGNLFGRGHVGSYALTASPDFDAYVAHSASYVVPLPARTLLTVGANHAEFRPRLAAPLDMHGTSSALAVRLEHGLRGAPGLHHSVLAGVDYKRSDSNVLFSSTPVFGVRTAILQAVLGYELAASDRWGRTALHAAWALSPGGTVGHDTDADFDASRAGARARYQLQTLAVERATVLPRGWEWNAQLRLQRTDANLLGSEQLAVTGADGVRAFREGALYADRGWMLRNEVGPAALAVGDAHVQPYAFVDAAEVGSAYPVQGEPSAVRLGSAGLGVRLTVASAFHVRAELGRPWKASQPLLDEGWRGHVALSWQF